MLGDYLDEYESVGVEGLPRFACGVVGFLGYDMVRIIEELREPKSDSIGTEDAVMGFYDNLVAFDHLKNEVIVIVNVFVDEDSHAARQFYPSFQKSSYARVRARARVGCHA